MAYLNNVWHVLLDLSPWLLLGCFAAGLLHVLLPPDFLHRHMGRPGFMSTVKASLLGVPMPLCSCGVIPAAIGLRRDGASRGAAVGFMISTPQTGVDSIAVSISFLGWPFAFFKVISAFATGLIGGVLTDALPADEKAIMPTVCAPGETPPKRRWKAIFTYGFGEVLGMIWHWIIIGILVSAAISTWVPTGALLDTPLSSGLTAMFVMLLISLPLYVCDVASVPIAASLVAAGMPAGAALVFLMAGPASNVATIGAVYKAFGKRALAVYLGTVAIGSILLGWAFDFVLGSTAAETAASHKHPGMVATLAAIALLIILAVFAFAAIRRRLARPPADAAALTLTVAGMTCGNCAKHVRDALLGQDGVTGVEVNLEAGLVAIHGDNLQLDELRTRILDAGYTPG